MICDSVSREDHIKQSAFHTHGWISMPVSVLRFTPACEGAQAVLTCLRQHPHLVGMTCPA